MSPEIKVAQASSPGTSRGAGLGHLLRRGPRKLPAGRVRVFPGCLVRHSDRNGQGRKDRDYRRISGRKSTKRHRKQRAGQRDFPRWRASLHRLKNRQARMPASSTPLPDRQSIEYAIGIVAGGIVSLGRDFQRPE